MPSRRERPLTLEKSGAEAQIADLGSSLGVIVTHPWGPLGGNMHNNVVTAAVLFFQELGITTLRFNFAGSQIGQGHQELQEVEEAANYLLQQSSCVKYILLVGYSYGSLIVSSASASVPQCIGVVSIAPPFGVQHWLLLFHSSHHLKRGQKIANLPRLFVIGTQDNLTSEDVFHETVLSFPKECTTGAILKDTNHFFIRREKDLMAIVGRWLMDAYPDASDLTVLREMNFDHILKARSKETIQTLERGLKDNNGSGYRNMADYDCTGALNPFS